MNDNPEIHSRRVARLKLVLPGIAAVLLGLLVLFSRSGDDLIQLAIFDGTGSGGGVVLRDPVMRGTTSGNVPYEISAATAHSQDTANALVNLREVNARFAPAGSAPGYVIEATAGLMNNETGLLDLRDGVTYRDDNGLVLVLIDFVYDTSRGTGRTKKSVSGTAPQGTLEAAGLQISQNPSAYIFERARLMVDLKPAQANK
jgi:hypothetical protein